MVTSVDSKDVFNGAEDSDDEYGAAGSSDKESGNSGSSDEDDASVSEPQVAVVTKPGGSNSNLAQTFEEAPLEPLSPLVFPRLDHDASTGVSKARNLPLVGPPYTLCVECPRLVDLSLLT